MPTGVRVLLAIWLLLAAIALGVGVRAAFAHGWYDPWCCSGDDCQPISPDDVVTGPKGFQVKGKWLVPYGDERIKQSQDADYHVCEYPKGSGTLRCFYVPAGGV